MSNKPKATGDALRALADLAGNRVSLLDTVLRLAKRGFSIEQHCEEASGGALVLTLRTKKRDKSMAYVVDSAELVAYRGAELEAHLVSVLLRLEENFINSL
jgi:hypothetical protein